MGTWELHNGTFLHPLSTLFQDRSKFCFFYLMQDDTTITCEIRRQKPGQSHGLERVWRLWRLWPQLWKTCLLAWTHAVEKKRGTAFHLHGPQMTWGGVQPFPLCCLCDQHVFRYFSKQEVIVRFIKNAIFHEDLQFLDWLPKISHRISTLISADFELKITFLSSCSSLGMPSIEIWIIEICFCHRSIQKSEICALGRLTPWPFQILKVK